MRLAEHAVGERELCESYKRDPLSPFPILHRIKRLCQVDISLEGILSLFRLDIGSGPALGCVQIGLSS
jgi:hypothetical protein